MVSEAYYRAPRSPLQRPRYIVYGHTVRLQRIEFEMEGVLAVRPRPSAYCNRSVSGNTHYTAGYLRESYLRPWE